MMNSAELLYFSRSRLLGGVLTAALCCGFVGAVAHADTTEDHHGPHEHVDHGAHEAHQAQAETRKPEAKSSAPVGLSPTTASLDDARIRLPLPGQTTAVIYLTVNNRSSQTLTVTGVEVAGSERAELHQHVHEDGMMRMRKVNRIVVAAGTAVEFTSGGYHIMAFDMAVAPRDAALQQAYPVTLIFESGERATVNAWPVH